MSKTDIPIDQPLSEENRAYLLMRGEQARVDWFDQQYPVKTDEERELEPEMELENDEEQESYEDMTVAELQTELKRRELDAKGNKQELIDRLEADDEEANE